MRRLAMSIITGCLVMGTVLARAEMGPSFEYQVKAFYIYNFLQFIDWPKDVFSSGKFHLCVSGISRFRGALDALTGERVEGREIVIHRLVSAADARDRECHLLYLSADGQQLGPIVSIGETNGFSARGGIINLVVVSGRVRFQINQRAAQQSGLLVSSHLLSLAAGLP